MNYPYSRTLYFYCFIRRFFMKKSIICKTNVITKIRWNVLSNINCICDSIVDCNLQPEHDTLYQTSILRLNEYFGTSEAQTRILCFAIWQTILILLNFWFIFQAYYKSAVLILLDLKLLWLWIKFNQQTNSEK